MNLKIISINLILNDKIKKKSIKKNNLSQFRWIHKTHDYK